MPELENPSIKLNGTAIMMLIQQQLERMGADNPPPAIWIGSEAYYRLLQAAMDAEWPFKADFDNEKALIFGHRFTVCNQYGEDAITYYP
jgi:hypothetical protein